MTFRTLTKHLHKDSNTLAHIIQTYTQSKQLCKGKLLHAQLITSAYPSCTYLTNHLLSMYGRCGQIGYAYKLFDAMPQRNLVSWTAMISGFSQNLEFLKAITTFCRMWIWGESPNEFAFSSVIQACSSLKSVQIGKQIHCLALKTGFSYELFVGSNLADMYSKCGLMIEACMVFEEMPSKDEVSWNSMIDGYAKNGYNEEALVAFRKMQIEDVKIDQHLLCSALCACGAYKAYNVGRCLHSFVIKLGFNLHVSVGNALTDMYCKLGDMDSGSRFLEIDSRDTNIVSYTSLIDGYVETEQIERALTIFVELKRQGIEPNEFTFSSLIKACANHAALEQGSQLHALVFKYNLDQDPFVSSIIVDMYGKCGLLDDSSQAFEKISKASEYAWNSLVGVFAHHGLGKEAIDVFDRMVVHNVKPNAVTFVNLLNACSHSKLVNEGLNYFNSMERIYGVKPRSEHYSCVIDLLGRAGRLEEAEIFIEKMPFEPNAYAWCSLLAACRIYGDKERGELAAESLKRVEPENSGAHVLLSNIYAKERQWEDVRSVRKMMKDGNVKKLPGFSWVDVDNKVHIFGAEDWCHPDKKEIDLKLDSLLGKIMEAGYVPDTGSISVDMEDAMKAKVLHRHSERMAIAFALIRMPIGKPIIVKKNIRVCVDCHSAIKLISKVEGRKIIVRDNSRFHHFVDGSCSCKDFW
ncbi:pentatricopeptide repeat-containing protein At4g14850-like [Cynara cardunculus var. scolymus]|uniref:pentatricopeptide repeat-containing protein At4g14850-like n=1 Tax=Cynara cardunculus var. scolymus TaxID=59895 RepID=UPI000D629338|nr:pentatricopeptide repeat-containing protein At4g14850-like [Cynara cardunculus var. scolymus]